MSRVTFTGASPLDITAALKDKNGVALTGNKLTKALKRIENFENKVEANKNASIKIGDTTFRFRRDKDDGSNGPAVSFTKDGTTFTTFAQLNADVTGTGGGSTGGGTVTPPAGPGKAIALTKEADVAVGTSGNDTITGTSDTFNAGDVIVDQSSTDNDVLTLTLTAAPAAATVSGIETINIDIASVADAPFNADSFSGVKELTVSRSNPVLGGASITGNKEVTVNQVDASKIAKITVGAGTTIVAVNQTAATDPSKSKTGVVVNADEASGAVTVTGAATISAKSTDGTVRVDGIAGASAAEKQKAVSISAAKAAAIDINANVSGAITVAAAAAKTVTIDDASGGATVAVLGDKGTLGTNGVVIAGIDDSGATVTTSYVGTKNNQGVISLAGGTGTSDKATVSAAGLADIRSTDIETLTLSGNGAALTATLTTSGAAPKTLNLTGSQSVTVKADGVNLTGATITDATTAGTTTVDITVFGANVDASKFAVDAIQLSGDGTSKTLTVSTGANVVLAKDQTTGFTIAGKSADATVSITTADDTGADGSTIDIAVGAFNLATNVATANITASVGRFTATGVTATTGSSGTAINISGSKDVTLGTVEAKSLSAANLTGKLSLTTVDTATVVGGSGNDTITANNAATKFNIDTGAGNDGLTITAAANESLFATGAGNDTVALNTAATVVVALGAGDDTLTVGANLSTGAVLIGGDGADTLKFADTDGQNISGVATFAFSGFETVDISELGSGEIIISGAQFGGQTFTLKGNAATDRLAIVGKAGVSNTINASTITVDTASLRIQGADKADSLTGSSGDDTFTATAGADTIVGGSGTDTYVAVTVATTVEGAGNGTQTGIVINLGVDAVSAATIGAAGVGVIANSLASVAAGTTAYLYAAAASTNSAVQQALSSIENVTGTGGADYIVGSALANSILGGDGDDVIIAGAGNDTVAGGAGADVISLGAGNDVLVFNSLTGADTITDYVVADDSIQLSKATFTGLGVVGALSATEFESGAGLNAAQTAAGRIVYNTTTGQLYYDADGSGAGAAVLIGTFTGAPTLVVGEFSIIL